MEVSEMATKVEAEILRKYIIAPLSGSSKNGYAKVKWKFWVHDPNTSHWLAHKSYEELYNQQFNHSLFHMFSIGIIIQSII